MDFEDIDSTLDKVIDKIYTSCDLHDADSVPVSVLIDYVTPFMSDNIEELHELKGALDPHNTNPKISRSSFYDAMNEWSRRLKNKQFENSFEEVDSNLSVPIDDSKLPLGQSTPRNSLGSYYRMVKNCSGILDVSHSKDSNELGINNNSVVNKSKYEEQMRMLQSQVQRTINELELVKQQMIDAEEQNDSLLAEITKLTRQLQGEREINKKMGKEAHDDQALLETIESLHNKIWKLESETKSLKKEKELLRDEIDLLQNEKINLETTIDSLNKHDFNAKQEINELQQIIQTKEAKLTSLNKTIEELKYQSKERSELILFYTNQNEMLTQKTNVLEKLIQDAELSKSTIQDQMNLTNLTKKNSLNDSVILEQSIDDLGNIAGGDSASVDVQQSQYKRSLRDELMETTEINEFYEAKPIRDELIEELHSKIQKEQLINNQLRFEIKVKDNASKQLKCEIAELKLTIDTDKEALQCFENSNINLQDINLKLERKLQERQTELNNFNDAIAELCTKAKSHFITFNCFDEINSDLEKLEKFVDFVTKQEEKRSQSFGKRSNPFNKQEIKFGRLQEKFDNLSIGFGRLQKDYNEHLKFHNEFKSDLENQFKTKLEQNMLQIDELNHDVEFLNEENKIIRDENKEFILKIQYLEEANNKLKCILIDNNGFGLDDLCDQIIIYKTNEKAITRKSFNIFSYFLSLFCRMNKSKYKLLGLESFRKRVRFSTIGKFGIYFLVSIIFLLFYVHFICIQESPSCDCPLDFIIKYDVINNAI